MNQEVTLKKSMKEEIRQYALNQGIDDIGFARAEDYQSPIGSEEFRRINQAHSIGMQYYCFNCMMVWPVGKGNKVVSAMKTRKRLDYCIGCFLQG